LILPYTQLAPLLGFTALPLYFYPWIGLIIVAYLVSAETAKRFFYASGMPRGN
jgi:Mg2+-importing ATPase